MTASNAPGGLELTEEQVAEMEYRSDLAWPTRIRQIITDWRTLRAACDAKDAEIARLKEPYVPCVAHFPEAGISEFVQEDVAVVWKWLGDGVQAGYAMDDGRLVGVQWPIASRPAPADAVKVLVEALRNLVAWVNSDGEVPAAYSQGPRGMEQYGSDCIDAARVALSDPRVIAAQSADPWCYDMSKAPRNGTPLLLFNPREPLHRRVKVGAWSEHTFCFYGAGSTVPPFAWMPLPAAPARQQEEPS